LKAKFDDFDVGSIFRKLTYPIGHRRFAKNSNPTLKAQIWPQMEFCKSLSNYLVFTGEYSIRIHTQFLTEIQSRYGPVSVAAFAASFLIGSIPQAYACGYMLSPLRGF
jgi:hypothetical protein